MSKIKNVAFGLAAAGLLFTFGACKKDNNGGDNNQVAAGALAKGDANWKIEEVNGLLSFIPEDSPMVYVTTRNVDFNHPVIQKALAKSAKLSETINKLSEIQAENVDEDKKAQIAEMKKFMDEWMPLYKDFKGNAKNFGINPDHYDAAVYMDGKVIVAKVSVDDGEMLKGKIAPLMDMMKTNGLNVREDGEWMILGMPAEAADDKIPDVKVALNYGKEIVTVAIYTNDAEFANLGRVLKASDKPLKKDALGKIENNVEGIGYIDNVQAISAFLAGDMRKAVEDILGEPIPANCDPEIKEIVADYPRIKIATRFLDNSRVSFEGTLVMNDKEALKKLADLHTPSLDIVKTDNVMSLKLNVNLGKIVSQVIEMADALSKKTYQCKPLAELTGAAKMVPEMVADPQFAMMRNVAEGLSGINMALDSLTLSPEPKFEAIVNITGERTGEVLPPMFMLVGRQVPGLTGITMDGPAVDLDLSELAGMDLKLKALMTKTDLLVATPNYDVAAISKGSSKSSDAFIEFQIGSKFYAIVGEEAAKAGDEAVMKDLKAVFSEMFTQTYTLGTNDEGIAMNGIITF